MGTKICPGCDIEKLFSEYSHCKGRKNNISTYCKVCFKIKYYETNKEEIKIKKKNIMQIIKMK